MTDVENDSADLERRINAARTGLDPHRRTRSGARAESLGWKVISELIAAILFALILGSYLDRVFGTKPWVMIALLVFGLSAAIWNIGRLGRVQAARENGSAEPPIEG